MHPFLRRYLPVLAVAPLFLFGGCATQEEVSTLRTEVSGVRDAAQAAANEARQAAESAKQAAAEAKAASEKAGRMFRESLRK